MQIHTFELCAQVSPEVYQACRDFFYLKAKGNPKCCYAKEKINQVTFNGWKQDGIIAYLKKAKYNYPFCYIHLRITPTRLLGCSDPTILFQADVFGIEKLSNHLSELFVDSPLLNQQFYLYRVDLCQDHTFESEKILLVYIHLLQRGAQSRWNIIKFDGEQDQHSFRRSNTRYQVTAYDKLYQLNNRNIKFEWHTDQRILRVEVSLFPKGIYHISSKLHLSKGHWETQVFEFAEYGEHIVLYVLKSLIFPGDYYTLNSAREQIEQSAYKKPKRKALYSFLEEINRTSNVNDSTIREHKNWKKRLRQLAALNINPVVIRSRAGIKYLPSLLPKPQSVYEIK